tara:strand:- start:222 stop:596 length:375 start_codon:yes stop_codon:yes gene_type:complete
MKLVILALANAASALATAAAAVAEKCDGASTAAAGSGPSVKEETTEAATETTKTTRKRGAAATETKAPEGKTYEEMREAIKPLVEEGRGEEVKKVIAKYSEGGLKELPVDKQGAFIKDIEALTL